MTISFVTWSDLPTISDLPVRWITWFTSWPGRWNHVTSFMTGRRTRDWLTGDDVSIRVLGVMLAGNFTVHQTPLPTTRPGLQGRDWNTVDVSSERTHFRPLRSVKKHDLLRGGSEGHAIGWLDMTSEVAFFWDGRLADAFKAEKPGQVRSVDEIPGRSGVGSSSQPAVHSNQFPGHPLPLLPTQVPGPQGWDWEWLKMKFFYVNTRWGRLTTSLPVD